MACSNFDIDRLLDIDYEATLETINARAYENVLHREKFAWP